MLPKDKVRFNERDKAKRKQGEVDAPFSPIRG